MVCRSTPGNSALTTYARAVSGLHDVQVLSLFHEIRSEIPRTDRSMADPDEVEASLEATYAAVGDRDGQAVFSDARRASIRERLRSASANGSECSMSPSELILISKIFLYSISRYLFNKIK